MLLLLAVLHLVHKSAQAAPFTLLLHDATTLATSPDSTTTCSCPDQRSVWNILWSCLATIFACSWVSVHPNIPGPDESRKRIALRRLELMVWTLIAPELIITWAMRQWVGARKLARLWREKGWTKTHGYFVQMGGFMLYEGSTPLGILSPERLKVLYEEGEIDFPSITEEEIRDRSKADALAKTFVVGQTTWFIAQCLARGIQGLDLTKLELVTVAFAFLNAFMYFLWWNKPLDVQSSVPVFLLDCPREKPPKVLSTPIEGTHLFHNFRITLSSVYRSFSTGASFAISWFQNTAKEKSIIQILDAVVILGPSRAVVQMFTRIGDMMESEPSSSIEQGQMRVATFYALHTVGLELRQILSFTSIIAVAFGAIHCAGWILAFPSHKEALIWQISSVTITVVPLFMVTGSAVGILNEMVYHWLWRKCFQLYGTFISLSVVFALPLYVAARLCLLIEAFVGLRTLTEGELAVVEWASFVPHI